MFLAGKDLKINSEVEGTPVSKLADIYTYADEGLSAYEVVKSEKLLRVIKEIPAKELKKALSEKYKRLDIAIFFNDLAEVKKTFALKTPVKRTSEYSLCYAVKSGNLNIVKAVFESGELDLTSYYVQEALEVASEYGYIDIVKYLIKNGLNPCDRQYYPLIWARKAGNQELVELLEKDIIKRLGKLPEIKDPYETWLANRKVDIQVEKVDIEENEPEIKETKLSGRGSVKAKLAKAPKKEKPKKEVKSLEELKKASAKLLKDKPKVEKSKEKKVSKSKEKPEKKKVLTLEELKARSQKLLDKR